MDAEMLNAVTRIAAHNLARDLASTRGENASEVATTYITEAYRSIMVGGDSYVLGQTQFADNFTQNAVNEYLSALASESPA